MGAGASTPVYSHRIEPARSYRNRQVAPPLQPMYRSAIVNDTVAVASRDRYLQKSPRNPSMMNSTQRNMMPVQGSAAPSSMQQDYTFVREKNIPKSGYVVQGGGEYITKAYQTEKRKPQPFVIQDMSEYELQSNGFYKLIDSGTYLLPTGSGFLPDEDVNDHPFAPSSSDTSTASVSSDNNAQLRKSKKNLDRFYSSSSDGSSNSAPKVARKGNTGVVLNQVKKALEATPPNFLVVPQNGSSSRAISPSPSIRSSVGIQTLNAPPNSGESERNEDMYKHQQKRHSENTSNRSPRHSLFHHHSSPELYRSNTRTVNPVGGSREDLHTSRHYDQSNKQHLTPARDKQLRFTGSVTRIDAPSPIDKNYLSPLTGAYDRSSEGASKNSPRGRPPHLTPSPQPTPRRRLRRNSAVSTVSLSPSTKSISRSPHQTPIKINTHGLVYI